MCIGHHRRDVGRDQRRRRQRLPVDVVGGDRVQRRRQLVGQLAHLRLRRSPARPGTASARCCRCVLGQRVQLVDDVSRSVRSALTSGSFLVPVSSCLSCVGEIDGSVRPAKLTSSLALPRAPTAIGAVCTVPKQAARCLAKRRDHHLAAAGVAQQLHHLGLVAVHRRAASGSERTTVRASTDDAEAAGAAARASVTDGSAQGSAAPKRLAADAAPSSPPPRSAVGWMIAGVLVGAGAVAVQRIAVAGRAQDQVLDVVRARSIAHCRSCAVARARVQQEPGRQPGRQRAQADVARRRTARPGDLRVA